MLSTQGPRKNSCIQHKAFQKPKVCLQHRGSRGGKTYWKDMYVLDPLDIQCLAKECLLIRKRSPCKTVSSVMTRLSFAFRKITLVASNRRWMKRLHVETRQPAKTLPGLSGREIVKPEYWGNKGRAKKRETLGFQAFVKLCEATPHGPAVPNPYLRSLGELGNRKGLKLNIHSSSASNSRLLCPTTVWQAQRHPGFSITLVC